MDPQGATLGNAHGYIDIDVSGVAMSLNQAKGYFNNFISSTGAAMQGFGSSLAGWGSQLTMWTAPLTVLGGVGLKFASDFDSVLTEIQARTGLTIDAMQLIKDEALRLGAETVFSGQQSLEAFLNLLTAGLDEQQALATLPHVLNAAAAGNMELAAAADMTTSLLASFNLEVSEAEGLVNSLSAAAASSPATLGEMGLAAKEVAARATTLGISYDELNAMLAIFAQNGVVGTTAGTQMDSMLKMMTADTDEAQAAWAELGISLFDAQGNMRDMDTIFGELKTAFADLSMEDQNRLAQQLAGSYGLVGFYALMGSDGISEMQVAMAGQTSAAEVAAQMMDTFKGSVDSLMGSIQAFWITVLTPFMNNVLKPLIGTNTTGLVGIVNAVTAWAAANEPLVQTIVTMTAAFLALGPTAWGLGEAIKFIGFNISTLGTIFGFLMSPLGLVIAGIGVLAFIFRDQLGAAIQTGMQWLDAVWIFLSTFASDIQQFGIGEAIMGIFGQGNLGETMQSSLEGLLTRFGMVRSTAIQVTNAAWNAFSSWYIRLRPIFINVSNVIGGFISTARNALNIFFGLLQNGVPIFTALQTAFGATFGTWDWAKIGADILAGLSAGVSTMGSWVYDNLISPMVGAFSLIDWGMVGNTILQGIGTAISLYPSWINFVTDNILTPLFDNAKTALSTINWRQLGEDIIGFIFAPFSGGGEAGGVDWGAVFGGWMDAIANAGAAVFDFLGWVFENITLPLWQGYIDGLSQVDWGQVGSTLMNLLGTALGVLWAGATWAYDNLILPLFDNARLAIESIDWSSVGYSIMTFIGDSLKNGLDWVAWLIDSIFNPMVAGPGAATEQVDWSGVAWAVFNAIQSAVWGVINFATWLYDTIFYPMAQGAVNAIMNTDWSAVGTNLMNAIAAALPDILDWVQTNIIGPIQSALGSFNPLASIGGTVTPYTTGGGAYTNANGGFGAGVQPINPQSNLNAFIGGAAGGVLGKITGFASGIDFVPSDMIALIHEGERVQRADENPYNPNAQTNGMGGMGTMVSFEGAVFHINARNEDEAERAARTIELTFGRVMRERGF